jgi:hypothetical protein
MCYSSTSERKSFMREYIAGRIPTIKLLNEAWAACQAVERDVMRSGILQQATGAEEARPSAPDLDGLSDEEVDGVYHRILRKKDCDSLAA